MKWRRETTTRWPTGWLKPSDRAASHDRAYDDATVLLNRSSQDDRGNRRDQSTSARRAAEALFSPRTEPPAQDAAPVGAAVRRPRILAVAAQGPVPQDEPETHTHAEPVRQSAIPAAHVTRIRIWLKHGMTAAQVADMYGTTAGEVERAIGRIA